MKINFTKMHGLGNDFMVIDAISQPISLLPAQIKELSDRHFGVGFDQILLIERSETADFRYRIFNADGSEVGQCGNGARCFARFVAEKELINREVDKGILVETKERTIRLTVQNDNSVIVNMGKPVWLPRDIPFNQFESTKATYTIKGETVGVVSMGNPHAVLIVDDINQEIETIAKKIQNSTDFPEGVNVNFVEIVDEFKVKLRVYERGVGETSACGSGACATTAYLDKIDKVNANWDTNGGKYVVLELQGGELSVTSNNNQDIAMWGSAEFVYEGQIEI